MIVELGNHAPNSPVDGSPCVTTIHIPDWDDGSTHPDAEYEGPHPHDSETTGKLITPGPSLGGYSHKIGAITVDEFRQHLFDAQMFRNGKTHLPDHEALISIVRAWPEQGNEAPRWLSVNPGLQTDPKVAQDIEQFLQEFYRIPGQSKPADAEMNYHTRWGPPGEAGPRLPNMAMLFTNDGRVQQAVNYGGGQVGTTGQATASSATSLTNSGAAWTTNQWAGYRTYATVSGNQMVWANIVSNTGTVLTVDQWYNPASPGGSAGSTPSATAAYLIADGGSVSAWFVGLTTTNITPAATDHALSGEYSHASAGMNRKIAPYALTSGTSPGQITLTPVYTANGSDTLPSTFYAAGAMVSMVVSDITLTMKFESSMNAAQTVSASGDQLTVTWTENFS